MSKMKTVAMGLALALLVAALYGQFLHSPLIFDDKYLFLMDADGNQPVSVYHFVWNQPRSFPYATLAWTKDWLGLDMANFRIGNLLLHAAVALALFAFLATLLNAVLVNQSGDRLTPTAIAFLASALFAVHPVATYATGYLVQRTIVMATLFSLTTMLAYFVGSLRNNAWWLWVSVLSYYLAVFSKEQAVTLIAVLPALSVLLHKDWREQILRKWPVFIAMLAIAIVAILVRKGLLGSVYEIEAPEMLLAQGNLANPYALSLMTQSWMFFKYLFLWLLPSTTLMSIDLREPFAPGLLSFYLLAPVAFLLWGFVGAWMLFMRGRRGLLGFSMLFVWLMFFTELSTVRVQEVFVLYRSYLWSIGVFCALALVIEKFNTKAVVGVAVLVTGVLFTQAMERLMTLSHPVLVWEDAEKKLHGRTDLPGAYRIYHNLGNALSEIEQNEQAIQNYQQAIALNNTLPYAHGNLGAVYLKQGAWQSAIDAFSRAIENAQQLGQRPVPRYIDGRGQAYEMIGEMQKAQADFKESCRLARRSCDKVL
jgi:tetratricopeptide (TPR) repeat protein